MTKKCCIPSCKVESDQPQGRDLTFHMIPSEKNIREKWINILRTKCNIILKKYFYICCLHFEPECFYYSGLCQNRRLKKGSCPTLFLDSTHESLGNNEDAQSDNYSEIESNVENEHTPDLAAEMSLPTSPSVSTITNMQQANKDNMITRKLENNSAIHNRTKSILNTDVNSLNVPEKIKSIINRAKTEIVGLRRRNRQLQMKLYRSRKRVKSASSLFSHMRKRKLIRKHLNELLEVSISSNLNAPLNRDS